MDLWIRSQNKMKLCNAISFELDNEQTGIFCNNSLDGYVFIGKYATKTRALEVLDEIQSKIKQQFICKYHAMLKSSDAKRIKEGLSKDYNGDFILETPAMDIQPINPHVLIYEMPEN